MPKTIRLFLFALIMVALFIQSGCAKYHKIPDEQFETSLTREAREGLGTVGVAHARFQPEADFSIITEDKFNGATKEALLATDAWIGGVLRNATGTEADLVMLAITPVFTVIGGFYGAIVAEPGDRVDDCRDALDNAIATLHIQKTMQEQVIMQELVNRSAEGNTHYTLVPIEHMGPSSPGEYPDYSELAGQGIDTVLELAVLRFGFTGPPAANPPLNFYMTLRIRLVSVSNGTVLYSRTTTHKSKERMLVQWAQDMGTPFSRAFNKAYRELARGTVAYLFPDLEARSTLFDTLQEEPEQVPPSVPAPEDTTPDTETAPETL